MITETSSTLEIYTAIDDVKSQMYALILSLDDNKINTIPYKESWTAAQLIRHVTKSTDAMSKAMLSKAMPLNRPQGEKIPQLRKIFLDFTSHLKSPDFIVPEEGPYKKTEVLQELNKSFDRLKESSEKADLTDIVEGLPFGPTTKLEILHFILYHTQRHYEQLKRITSSL